jgi:arylsulfatase A-like enzyme
LTGSREHGRDSVHAMYRDVQRMVSDGSWKLIRYYRSEQRQVGTDRLQLFDLDADPWELADRSADSACREILERLADDLVGWQHEIGDPLAERQVVPVC